MEDPAFTRPGYVKIAIENDHLWIYLQKMVIFHSYVNVYQRVYQILLWMPPFSSGISQLAMLDDTGGPRACSFKSKKPTFGGVNLKSVLSSRFPIFSPQNSRSTLKPCGGLQTPATGCFTLDKLKLGHGSLWHGSLLKNFFESPKL